MHCMSPLRAAAGAVCRAATALVLASAALSPAHAEDLSLKTVQDPEDGQIDLSEWLLDRKGLLPVPIVITEPAAAVAVATVVLALLVTRIVPV